MDSLPNSAVSHRFSRIKNEWLKYPILALMYLMFMPLWRGYWGIPLIAFIVVGCFIGLYTSFWSIEYRKFMLFGTLPLTVLMIFLFVAGPAGIALFVSLKLSKIHSSIGILIIGCILAISIICGAVKATRIHWDESQKWLRQNANVKRFRVYQPEPDGSSAPSNLKMIVVFSGAGLALINLVGYFLYRDANVLRVMMLPSIAILMLALLGRAAYVVVGNEIAVVIQMGRLERTSGHRFILGNIEELHRARRAHWLGRFITPKELKLDPIYGRGR